jgi:hypothetical protein
MKIQMMSSHSRKNSKIYTLFQHTIQPSNNDEFNSKQHESQYSGIQRFQLPSILACELRPGDWIIRVSFLVGGTHVLIQQDLHIQVVIDTDWRKRVGIACKNQYYQN